jgi:hypothetical protein
MIASLTDDFILRRLLRSLRFLAMTITDFSNTLLDTQTGRRVPLFNPRHQRWARHFTWSDDYTKIIGRTATGRATVDALHMNRTAMCNLRRAWYAVGVHPAQTERKD